MGTPSCLSCWQSYLNFVMGSEAEHVPSFSLDPPLLNSEVSLPTHAQDVTLKLFYVQCVAAATYSFLVRPNDRHFD